MPKIDKITIISNLATAFITAIAMIIVAYIGILPQMGKKEKNLPTFTVCGTVFKDKSLTQTIDKVEIFLLPATGNEQATNADDKGEFRFKNVQERNWWIIARNLNSNDKSSCKYQLDPTVKGDTIKLSGIFIKYKIQRDNH